MAALWTAAIGLDRFRPYTLWSRRQRSAGVGGRLPARSRGGKHRGIPGFRFPSPSWGPVVAGWDSTCRSSLPKCDNSGVRERIRIPPDRYDRDYFLSEHVEGYPEFREGRLSWVKRKQTETLALACGVTILLSILRAFENSIGSGKRLPTTEGGSVSRHWTCCRATEGPLWGA